MNTFHCFQRQGYCLFVCLAYCFLTNPTRSYESCYMTRFTKVKTSFFNAYLRFIYLFPAYAAIPSCLPTRLRCLTSSVVGHVNIVAWISCCRVSSCSWLRLDAKNPPKHYPDDGKLKQTMRECSSSLHGEGTRTRPTVAMHARVISFHNRRPTFGSEFCR